MNDVGKQRSSLMEKYQQQKMIKKDDICGRKGYNPLYIDYQSLEMEADLDCQRNLTNVWDKPSYI